MTDDKVATLIATLRMFATKDSPRDQLTLLACDGLEELLQLRATVKHVETQHEARWHATYNAALTGVLAGSQGLSVSVADFALLAVEHANALHGKLPAPEGGA